MHRQHPKAVHINMDLRRAAVAEPAAIGQKIHEGRALATGGGTRGEVLVAVADAHQLKVVFAVKRDRVVRALAGVGAAGMDVEPEARVGLHAPLETRNADHDVIDTGQHRAGIRYLALPPTFAHTSP